MMELDWNESIDIENTQTLGLQLIFKFSLQQLEGELDLDRSNGNQKFTYKFKKDT